MFRYYELCLSLAEELELTPKEIEEMNELERENIINKFIAEYDTLCLVQCLLSKINLHKQVNNNTFWVFIDAEDGSTMWSQSFTLKKE
jgi:hypothetical protein